MAAQGSSPSLRRPSRARVGLTDVPPQPDEDEDAPQRSAFSWLAAHDPSAAHSPQAKHDPTPPKPPRATIRRVISGEYLDTVRPATPRQPRHSPAELPAR